jgi:predicted O-methyltransferase YrrM
MPSVNWHRRVFETYQRLPRPIQRVIRAVYEDYLEGSRVAPNYQRGFVRQFFNSEAEFESYVTEFERSGIMDSIDDSRTEHRQRTGHGRFAAINQFTHPRLWALVRKLKPDTIVETGVCNGVSTFIVLQALKKNGHGHLHSVDYPDPDRIPDGEEPGWIIPDELRHRWSLTKGMSQEELPKVVEALDRIDIFLHDTMATVLDEELDIVWSKLATGAVITADDVHKSNVFGQVVESRSVDHGYVAPNVGYLIKRE